MNIVFFSPNGQPNGPRKRIYNYSKRLIERGHNVTIFTKQHFHGTDFKYKLSNKNCIVENIDGINTVWIDTIKYKSNGINRLVSEFQFILKSIKGSINLTSGILLIFLCLLILLNTGIKFHS